MSANWMRDQLCLSISKTGSEERFAQNVLFICLNVLHDLNSTTSAQLLARETKDWIDLLKKPSILDWPIQHSEVQSVSLLWHVSRFSGGKDINYENPCSTNFTAKQNLDFCARAFGVSGPNYFGESDQSKMTHVLARSKIFSGFLIQIELLNQMPDCVPVGFPKYTPTNPLMSPVFDLPPQLLHNLTLHQLDTIGNDIEQACVKRRSLELSGTSILLLLSCIDTFDDGIYKTTKYWATTTEGKNIYEFWKKAFQYSKPFNELALILPALFSMERFRSCPYPKEPALVSFTDFSWVLQTEGYKNLPFFEKMIKAMKGVAHYNGLQEENEDVIHRLELPLSKFSPMADALDSMFDYYCMRRIDPQQALSHLDAYKATLENVSSLYRDVLFELQITNSWLDVGYVEVIE